MNEFTTAYFPRLHTALAEWLACAAFIVPLRKQDWKEKQWASIALFLVLMIVTFHAMERAAAVGFLWMAFMLLASAQMLLFIYLRFRPSIAQTIYCWARAFLFAETAASLEWQINYYLIKGGVVSSINETYICMTVVYALFFCAVLLYRVKNKKRSAEKISMSEALSAAGIAIGAFVISNLQFAVSGSVFSASLGDGVLYARTLVDISGVIMLYANGEQRREMYLRYELDAISNLLQRQYEQYQQFEANNEAMRRVYHDLKHQIAYLESETNLDKRLESLSEMKEIIRTNESKVSTGNSVLDTLLTAKNLICAEEGIQMSCFADASRIGFIDAMDICCIFGNAIDNAIEYERKLAVADDRLIRVYIGARGSFLLIKIENFCDARIDFDGDTPVTTKEDKHLHGFGLRSIRRSVEKYQGHINLEQAGGWFTLTVLLPMPQTP
ncbi:MAG: GHKL domain-containing protein [Oscillospiraceae bacterium]|jgi:signal transduction histidine kinase|nr:GHKL domain-containing protein [Oscillospiraceae bacterium]